MSSKLMNDRERRSDSSRESRPEEAAAQPSPRPKRLVKPRVELPAEIVELYQQEMSW
jgi:hypothetical protein